MAACCGKLEALAEVLDGQNNICFWCSYNIIIKMAPTICMSSSGEEDKSNKKKKQKQVLLHSTISQKSRQWSSVNSEYKGKLILLSTSIYNGKVPEEEEGVLFQ